MAVAVTMGGNENDQLGNHKSDGKSSKLVEALKAVCRCFTSCLPFHECFSRVEEPGTASANQVLNQDDSKLQNQMGSLKQESDMEIQKLHEYVKEVTLLAVEESSKCRAMKEICVSTLEQMKEMARKLPPEVSPGENFRATLTRAEDFLKEFESSSVPSNLIFEQQKASSVLASNLPEHRIEGNNEAAGVDQSQDGGNVLQESNRYSVPNIEAAMPPLSSKSPRSVIEFFERGVYVTVVVNPDGSKVFQRIRFSKRRFHAHQAEEWWNRNKDKVLRKYSPQATNPEGSG